MNKALVLNAKAQDTVVRERLLLGALGSHPGIAQLLGSWQDRDMLYMLTEFVIAGDLGTHLGPSDARTRPPVVAHASAAVACPVADMQSHASRASPGRCSGCRACRLPCDRLTPRFGTPADCAGRLGRFSPRATRLFAGGAVLALEHMHSLSIAHRDIKPENIMVSLSPLKGAHYAADGWGGWGMAIKLQEFSTITQISSHAQGRTYTVCGTPEYMAPEVINGTGVSVGQPWGPGARVPRCRRLVS